MELNGPNDFSSSATVSLDFESMYNQYATDLMRVSYYYLGNRQQAEDVTQDVFVKLILTRPQIEPGKEKVTYVKLTAEKARRIIVDHIVNGNVVTEYTIGAMNAAK